MAPKIELTLSNGKVVIETYPEKAPKHVERVCEIADAGHYNGLPFHRVIEGFMAQTGNTGKGFTQMMAEFNDIPHVEGICSMARTPHPHSASDQFFICFGDAPWLNGQYTVWGKVIEGIEHVRGITRGEPPLNPTRIVSMKTIKE